MGCTFGRVAWKTGGKTSGTWVVETEVIGEWLSLNRRDPFLAGGSVTICNRMVSPMGVGLEKEGGPNEAGWDSN